ncbi:MAG TPA: DUF4382 domain-containing protein [Steroidobacteraceae bacterium]
MSRPTLKLGAPVLLLAAVLGGCSSRTNVSAIGNVPGQYSHVYITAQAVWFNSSATAGPDDSGWVKFPLSSPATVDLVTDSNGNFGNLITALKLQPGSYSQVRLIPVDASAPLTLSAQTIGAKYNAEVDYVDSAGNTQQLPLELLNPDRGIGIQASLSVPLANIGAAFGSTTTPTSTSPLKSTATATTTSTSSTSTTTTANFALSIDGARDLTAFYFDPSPAAGATAASPGTPAVMLSSHASAYNLSASGGIQGTLTLTNLANIGSASGLPDIQVSAELLSADGSRHVVVASAPVNSAGTFTLYPLAANSSNITDYDLVIHGHGIATIIIKTVQIPATGSSTSASTTGTSTSTSSTTSTTTSGTITPTNLVSVGTLIPRAATSFYSANITASAGAALPAGAQVEFYQTLPASGEVPYVIAASPIDPFNQNLANPLQLAVATVDSGTYVSSGATITVVSSQAHEGAPGTYQVAATAPLYADGMLSAAPPPAAGATTTSVPVAGLSLSSGSTAATLAATVSPRSTYDHGVLLVSHDGQLVASAALDSVIGLGGTVQVTGIPGGTSASLYYLTVRAWNSGTGAVARQWYSAPVDLRSASSANVQLTVN